MLLHCQRPIKNYHEFKQLQEHILIILESWKIDAIYMKEMFNEIRAQSREILLRLDAVSRRADRKTSAGGRREGHAGCRSGAIPSDGVERPLLMPSYHGHFGRALHKEMKRRRPISACRF